VISLDLYFASKSSSCACWAAEIGTYGASMDFKPSSLSGTFAVTELGRFGMPGCGVGLAETALGAATGVAAGTGVAGWASAGAVAAGSGVVVVSAGTVSAGGGVAGATAAGAGTGSGVAGAAAG